MHGLFLVVAASLALAQAEVPPSPELIDRFIAVLPEPSPNPDALDAAELDRLTRLNPGRDSEIRPILEAHARCAGPPTRAAANRAMRRVAGFLGTGNVEAMIRFYQGPDFALFGRLAEKTERTPQESAEFERLTRTYPVEAFAQAMQRAVTGLFEDEALIASFAACDTPKAEALRRANLRSED